MLLRKMFKMSFAQIVENIPHGTLQKKYDEVHNIISMHLSHFGYKSRIRDAYMP